METSDVACSNWTDAFLDEMRTVGDPLADDAVTALFASQGTYSVWDLMKTLVGNDQPPPDKLPRELRGSLEEASRIPPADPTAVEGGQKLFAAHGPEILMVLAFYSLPASYAAGKGVQVLYRSGYLNNRPNHRLFETTQMVMDVMLPGGLNAAGRGVRSAQKVRLMHAAIRHLIVNDPENPWQKGWGLPINQEDLAGTLMVFTWLILEGLEKLGIEAGPEEQQGYLETWKVIARLIGIREELIPADVVQARSLCAKIQTRQVAICPEGKAMTDALLSLTEHKLPPGPLRHWPAALMRHFLPEKVADGFEIPMHRFDKMLLSRVTELRKKSDPALEAVGPRLWAVREFALLFMRMLVTAELGGKRTPFILPTTLYHGWAKAHQPSLWEQLTRKI